MADPRDPGGLDFFDFSGTTENWWEPADAGPDFDRSPPIIDLAASEQASATEGPELFVNPSTGDVVDGSGTRMFSQAELDEAMRAYREGERDLSAAPPGSPEERSIWDRIAAAFGPINAALRTPLGATLATLGLGGLGTAIGALAAGDGPSGSESLQRLARQGPTLPPAVAAGQREIEAALSGAGGEALRTATIEALRAQAGGAEYLRGLVAQEAGYDATEQPALTDIRRAAIADLPGSTTIAPRDRPALYAPLVARSAALLSGDLDPVNDPVGASLRGTALGLLGGDTAPTVPAAATGERVALVPRQVTAPVSPEVEAAAWRVWDNARQGALWGLERIQQEYIYAGVESGQAMQMAQQLHGELARGVNPHGPTIPSVTTIRMERVRVPAPAEPAGQGAPVIAAPSTAPLEDPIQAGLGAELTRAFEGKVANPALERSIVQGRETLVNQLRQQLGTNTPELTTAGAQRLAEYDFAAHAMLENDRRSVIAQYAPLEEARRRFGIEFPESRYQRRLSIVLPEERARTQFNFQAPRQLRLQELGVTGPLVANAEAQSEARRAARFDQNQRLSTVGRRPVIPAIAAASGIMPASGLTGTTAATNASSAAFQTSVAAANAAAQERANTATQIAKLFTTAATPLIQPRVSLFGGA